MVKIKYISPINPHVHFRWEEYEDYPFLEWGFEDAEAAGIQAVVEQPNTTPTLTDTETIKRRLEFAKPHTRGIKHKIHIGLTDNLDQVRNAFTAIMRNEYGLASAKAFWVHSTGRTGILDEGIQRRIWEIAGEIDFRGVLFQHCEAEDAFSDRKFDPLKPITHSIRQNPESELVMVERQMANASNAKFKGIFYIAHVSNPETVDYVEKARARGLPYRVILESTWHHPFLNTTDYELLGNGVKMNPPLRPPEMQEKLLDYLIAGKFDIIGCDHAPHPKDKKLSSLKPPSGIRTLPFYPKGVELVRNYRIKEEKLRSMTFDTPNELFFNGELKPKEVEVEYDPERWNRSGYNPFSRVDGTLN